MYNHVFVCVFLALY